MNNRSPYGQIPQPNPYQNQPNPYASQQTQPNQPSLQQPTQTNQYPPQIYPQLQQPTQTPYGNPQNQYPPQNYPQLQQPTQTQQSYGNNQNIYPNPTSQQPYSQTVNQYSQTQQSQNPYSQQTYQQPSLVPPNGWLAFYFNQARPEEIPGLFQYFNNVDQDRSGAISAQELANIKFESRPIGIQTASKLVAVFDQQRTGSINFSQYLTMHKFIEHMRKAFTIADNDRSGRIESKEIFTALQQSSFQFITFPTIQELMKTFDKTRSGLDWSEFLLLCGHIAHCRSVFEWNDRDKTGYVRFTIDELTQISAYLNPSFL